MADRKEYTIEDIENYLVDNLLFIGDRTEVDETYDQVMHLLVSMPYEFQRVVIEQKTKFVHCDTKTYGKEFDNESYATSVANEIYFPENVTLDTLRHEVEHTAERGALHDHPNCRPRSLFNKGYYTTASYSSVSEDWKAAASAEISDKNHCSGRWWFKKFKDILYNGDESAIGYLRHTKGDLPRESFAEITRKYLSLYDLHLGNYETIDEILASQYPKLWPIYRDEAMKEMDKAPSEFLQAYFNNYKGALLASGGSIGPVTKRDNVSSYSQVMELSRKTFLNSTHELA